MARWKVSQAERWHTVYIIEAETKEQALERLSKYFDSKEEEGDYILEIRDPEYLEDLTDDYEIYELERGM